MIGKPVALIQIPNQRLFSVAQGAQCLHRFSLWMMVAVMGETGIRKGEELGLKWKQVDLKNRILTIEKTKNNKVRKIPLSSYAILWLNRLVRYLNCPYVFVSSRSRNRWVNPDKAFKRGCNGAGLESGVH